MSILCRGDIVDVLFRDSECIVLTSSQCLRLSVVPTAIVRLVENPRSLVEVVDELDELFGPAPQGRLAVIIDELASQGVVRLDDGVCSEEVSTTP